MPPDEERLGGENGAPERDALAFAARERVGTSPQYLSYILYGVRSGEKYLPALIAALKLDPRKVEKATAA